MAHQFLFSPHILDNLPSPQKGFDVVQDITEPRLRMYITARGVKTFFTRKRVRGKDQRIIIGNYPETSIESARMKLSKVLVSVARPTKVRKKSESFGAVIDSYIAKKIRRDKKSLGKLIRASKRMLGNLYDRDISSINAEILNATHTDILKNIGATTANRMREFLRGVFKFAVESGYVAINPAEKLPKSKVKKAVPVLNKSGLRRLMFAFEKEENAVVRKAFQMLCAGFDRRGKIFAMKWSDLDFNSDTWNGRPLSDGAVVILRDMPQNKKYVFPGRGDKSHLTDPRAAWTRACSHAKLSNISMDDVYKCLVRNFEWSPNRETLRGNMNSAMREIMSS
jgi:integrase